MQSKIAVERKNGKNLAKISVATFANMMNYVHLGSVLSGTNLEIRSL